MTITAEEYLAKAERAKAAGDTAAEARLRAAAEYVQKQPQLSADEYRAKAARAKAAGDIAAHDRLLAAADHVSSKTTRSEALYAIPPRADTPASPPVPPKPDTWGDTAAAMMEGPLGALSSFAGGLSGGQSPTRNYLANDPLTRGLPGPALTGLGAVGDVGGAALSGLGAGIAGGIGLATELVPGQSPQQEGRLGRDLLGMTMFAVPELAGASSFAGMAGRMAGAAERVAPAAKAALAREQVAALAAKAGRNGMGATKARAELAAEAKINPEAKAAADRLGIALPADVFSDNQQLRAVAGYTRSQIGSEAQSAWRDGVKNLRDRAEEILSSFGGSTDIASVSEKVKSSLSDTQKALQEKSDAIYDTINAAIPDAAVIKAPETSAVLKVTIDGLGGAKAASGRLTPAENRLVGNLAPKKRLTYAALDRERRLIGKAIRQKSGPYADADSKLLGDLYRALSVDQEAAIASIGDSALAEAWGTAKELVAKRKAIEESIVDSFGRDISGSIVPELRSAMQRGGKGDISGISGVLKIIPEELRKESVATAIATISKSARSSEPGFGLTEFAKAWTGISQNAPVRNQIGKVIGPESMKMLDDLNAVAQRVNQANANITMTGASLQKVGFNATNLVGRVLQSTGGQRAARAAGAAGGAVTGGPMGAIAGSEMAAALTAGRTDGVLAAGRLFSSPEFTQAAIEGARGAVTPRTKAALAKSRPFQSWARVAKVADPTAWLDDALKPPVAAASAQSVANDNVGSPYDGLFQRYGGQK
jgi:ElaB/YqjD/DUF883 family membrane-anchored ribosome-binding protein